MKWFVVVLLVLAGIGSSIALLARPGVEASPDATITVDSIGDNEDRDGVITLREAILRASFCPRTPKRSTWASRCRNCTRTTTP